MEANNVNLALRWLHWVSLLCLRQPTASRHVKPIFSTHGSNFDEDSVHWWNCGGQPPLAAHFRAVLDNVQPRLLGCPRYTWLLDLAYACRPAHLGVSAPT